MKLLSSDIGIIGGTDGPTAILVSTSDDFLLYAGIAIAVIVTVITTVLIIKRKKK